MGAEIGVALLAASAINTGLSIFSSTKQAKQDKKAIELESRRAKEIAAEEAALTTKNFRSALSSQIALASLRQGAGGSLVSQFGSASMANYAQDMLSNQKKVDYIEQNRKLGKTGVNVGLLGKVGSSLGGFAINAADAYNLNK